MRVLVGYASAHGATKGIAEEIGDRLTGAGHKVDVRSLAEGAVVGSYDAAVLGSAIHNQGWLPEAARFLTSHARELAIRPVWIFSVSSVGDTSSFFGPAVERFVRRIRKETGEIAGFRRAIRPRDHRNFAGAVERNHWNLAGHLFMKAFGGRYGDHRDWRDIDAWSDGIARQLRPTETISRSASAAPN